MEHLKCNRTGFITNYLVSGPRETDFLNDEPDDNQLRYEQYLRTIAADRDEIKPDQDICLGKNSRLGLPWRYYFQYGNWFVDESTFYSTLKKVEMDAVTGIYAEQDMGVRAAVWSYCAVKVWCNDAVVCEIHTPVYKPIIKEETELKLKKGFNRVYVRLQTLGVRDTRTLFGIQILEHAHKIHVVLPDEQGTQRLVKQEQWLNTLKIRDSVMTFKGKAPEGARLAYDSQSADFAMVKSRKEWKDISGEDQVILEMRPGVILVSVSDRDTVLTRTVENILAQRPVYSQAKTWVENKKEIFMRAASIQSLSRGDKFGFSISALLARKAMGMELKIDRDLLLETLDQIESRYDCSDFLVCGLVRYIKNYPLDEELEKRVKEVLCGWRYWMDQKGSDAMCFWSENHSLMFYTCAMNVGGLYSGEYFTRTDMTGRELHEWGKKRVSAWLTDVERYGFEEFLSTVYMCVTFAALLNVIDYSSRPISDRAAAITDRLLEMLCRHTFDGSIIAPMGRVYREVIYPFRQGAQALINLINPSVPYSFGEGWLGFYATSAYKPPTKLGQLMKQPVSTVYPTGNALIYLKKTEDYCLTSVQSPRQDKEPRRWKNLTLDPGADPSSYEYTKSLNERFHGTTCFEPGVYGYQQHMWYAALDKETGIFTNHPGGTCDSTSMRPGYWSGNGMMPALLQKEHMLLAVYHISHSHPIHFTHAYVPVPKFDEIKTGKHWITGKKGNAYAALWCSGEMEEKDDQLFDCEYRTYGDDIAYFYVCGSGKEFRSMEDFEAYAKGLDPVFHKEDRRLTAAGLALRFTNSHDMTQYI